MFIIQLFWGIRRGMITQEGKALMHSLNNISTATTTRENMRQTPGWIQ